MFVVSQIKSIKQRTIALLTSLSLHLLDEVTFLCWFQYWQNSCQWPRT